MNLDSILSNIYLLMFIISWVLTIIYYYTKKKNIDAGAIILITYLLYSIASLILFNNPYYSFESIKLFPFVYLFLLLLLFFLPILRYNYNDVDTIQKPPKLFLNIIIYIYITASFSQLPDIYSEFSKNIVKLLLVSSGGQDLYNEAMADSYKLGDGSVSNLPSIITNAYGNIGILLFFYYLTLKDKNKFISISLFISCIIGVLNNISLGQRGPVLEILLSMIITYFLLRKFYDKKTNKILKYIGIVFFTSALIPIIALTNSRFADSDGGSESSIYFYVGQENLYFNNYALDNGGLRYADRTFPLFKKMIGFENVPDNFWERRNKYPNLKINDEVFINFVGDFTLDFGPYLTTIFFALFTIFVLNRTIIRNRVLLFHQLILLHFVSCVAILGGMKLYPFSDIGGNLQLIFYILVYSFFKFTYYKLQKPSHNFIQ